MAKVNERKGASHKCDSRQNDPTLSLQYEFRNNVIVRSNFKSDTRYSIKKLIMEIRKSSQWS